MQFSILIPLIVMSLASTSLVKAADVDICQKAEKDFEKIANRKNARAVKKLHDHFVQYGSKCDDGGFAEAYSDTIQRLLGADPTTFKKFLELMGKNPNFYAFVLKHIDSTGTEEYWNLIKKRANSSCAPSFRKSCDAVLGEVNHLLDASDLQKSSESPQSVVPQTNRVKQFETDELEVWKTTIYPKQPLKLHRHDHKRILVALTDVALIVKNEEGTVRPIKFSKGTAHLLEADKPGELHVDINESDTPMEVMIIQFKK